MSCQHCKYNNKPSCDPDVNEFGGCASFRADWEPDESDNGGFDDTDGTDTTDGTDITDEDNLFKTLGEAFRPEIKKPC